MGWLSINFQVPFWLPSVTITYLKHAEVSWTNEQLNESKWTTLLFFFFFQQPYMLCRCCSVAALILCCFKSCGEKTTYMIISISLVYSNRPNISSTVIRGKRSIVRGERLSMRQIPGKWLPQTMSIRSRTTCCADITVTGKVRHLCQTKENNTTGNLFVCTCMYISVSGEGLKRKKEDRLKKKWRKGGGDWPRAVSPIILFKTYL